MNASNQQATSGIRVDLTPRFVSNELPVRTVSDHRGQWFVAKDICGQLGYKNHNDAVAAHCLELPTHLPLVTARGVQSLRVLSQADVDRLLQTCKLNATTELARRLKLQQGRQISAADLMPSIESIRANAMPQISQKPLVAKDLSEESIQSLQSFMSLQAHERCLRLAWVAGTSARAAVLWQLCERHARRGLVGSVESAIKVSANDIVQSSGNFFGAGCSESRVSASMHDLLEKGLLQAPMQVDNIKRKLWLNWPALEGLIGATDIPDLLWLELNWIAKNKAEMVVLHWLVEGHVGKFSASALARQYKPKFGTSVKAAQLSKAVQSLVDRGLIEPTGAQIGPSAHKSYRLVAGKLEGLLKQFYQQDLENLLGR